MTGRSFIDPVRTGQPVIFPPTGKASAVTTTTTVGGGAIRASRVADGKLGSVWFTNEPGKLITDKSASDD